MHTKAAGSEKFEIPRDFDKFFPFTNII